MKIIIEMEGNDPLLSAVMAVVTGGAPVHTTKDPAPIVSAPKATAPVTPKTTTPVQPKVVEEKVVEPEVEEGNGSADSSAVQDQPKTTAQQPASDSAPSKTATGDEKVDLPALQALAAQLLQAGERRTLKSILDENGVKSLSTAPEEAYEMLFGALSEAVAALAAA